LHTNIWPFMRQYAVLANGEVN